MKIEKYKETDINGIISLFYDTVHSVNAQDYSQEQLDVWAPKTDKESKLEIWKSSLNQNISYVAKINDTVVCFSDLTITGHLYRLYVHKNEQGKGIASALVDILEVEAKRRKIEEVDTEASITAKPFFERRGYVVIKSQTVERNHVELTNYKMVKKL
ncbi:GNAT family N-acetyltransferase [Chengkuizengella axinellae]|uniref:GNAT family N-acetyltransferase n=1 Tax=Chengkuizengella axinellae TaxID=3064388 RepID=A0ABT9IY00_9BACL|nr:GNAT family N-acetyltransferase [Chengkuizengella sp. 2205SS18-9]MDP5274197.1 GNAT family N-acetyltransferase [Chengkuizengella sp. 2205SS18-9]